MLLMIVSKSVAQCDTNSICTKKIVLKYLYEEAENAAYLRTDTAFLNLVIEATQQKIKYKDSLIVNRNEALGLCKDSYVISQLELNNEKKQVKVLSKKVSLFKTLTLFLSGLAVAVYFIK